MDTVRAKIPVPTCIRKEATVACKLPAIIQHPPATTIVQQAVVRPESRCPVTPGHRRLQYRTIGAIRLAVPTTHHPEVAEATLVLHPEEAEAAAQSLLLQAAAEVAVWVEVHVHPAAEETKFFVQLSFYLVQGSIQSS